MSDAEKTPGKHLYNAMKKVGFHQILYWENLPRQEQDGFAKAEQDLFEPLLKRIAELEAEVAREKEMRHAYGRGY